MKLHDCKPNQWIRVLEAPKVAPTSIPVVKGEIIYFEHADGMYSLCKTRQGTKVHLVMWTEVEAVDIPGN